MRKRLSALLVLLIVAVLALGAVGSAAWFTDTDTATNSFTAGTLSVHLGGPSGDGVTITAPDNVPPINEIGGMAPGEWFGPYQINVVNDQNPQSTLEAKYRFTTMLLGGDAAMWSKLNARVETGNCVGGGIANNYDIYSGPLAGLEIISNDDSGPNQLDTVISADGFIDPQNTHCFLWHFQLDPTAGNDAQGDTVQFEIDLDATTPSNPGWSE